MIKIKREKGFAGSMVSYKILIDEKEVGKIGNDKEIELNVSKGNHKIYLDAGWGAKSNVLDFEYNMSDIQFLCGTKMPVATMVLAGLGGAVGALIGNQISKNKTIWIKQI
jgi:hypothetical protein